MAPNTYTWVSAWFLLSAPVIIWDASYCLMRPRSMIGGDLHWIWKPYGKYQEVDDIYGVKALIENNGFTNAQAFLNLIETALNLFYLYLAHVAEYPSASVVGFASAVMTLSKTVLYWLQEYYCNLCDIGHNDLKTLVVYWIIPNGLWIVIPTLIVYKLGKDITSSIDVAARESEKKASGKSQ
ncbi:hypothetical protein F5148DRAFT_1275021 [Russula earlei]|uniref:Uncharacterized protein n=1 Tax=Russula earlei TaxID=71964 RepID=A0ACC0UE59_9AGAM|nr:hypothetical protein F5148DRAFT_1275021 [Russula earlei]